MPTPQTVILPALNLVFGNGSTLQGISVTPGDNTVTNSKIPAGANIDPTKIGYLIRRVGGQGGSAAVASDRQTIHYVVGSSGSITGFKAGLRVANVGAAT